jgi:hypothetical protein
MMQQKLFKELIVVAHILIQLVSGVSVQGMKFIFSFLKPDT